MSENEIPVERIEPEYDPDWVCSKCNKTPRVMHDTDKMICLDCYEDSEPGPVPSYVSGDRVETPEGPGTVNYVIAGTNERDSAVSVLVDAHVNTRPHYKGSTYLAELVKPVERKRRR